MTIYNAKIISIASQLRQHPLYAEFLEEKPAPDFNTLISGDLDQIAEVFRTVPGNGKFWYKNQLERKRGRSPKKPQTFYVYSTKTGLCLAIEKLQTYGNQEAVDLNSEEKIKAWAVLIHELLLAGD